MYRIKQLRNFLSTNNFHSINFNQSSVKLGERQRGTMLVIEKGRYKLFIRINQ